MTGYAASCFEYKYNAPPVSFQAQVPPFCDRRQRIVSPCSIMSPRTQAHSRHSLIVLPV